jgi:hypothetical protein
MKPHGRRILRGTCRPVYPFDPRKILDVTGVAHRHEWNLDNVSGPSTSFAFRALDPPLRHQRDFSHQSAASAVVPLRKAKEWDCEITVRWRIVAAHPAVIRREEEMADIEARSKSPFIYLILSLVDVLGIAGFVLEPVVKPAANDGNPVRQDHHCAGAKG